MMPDIYTPQKRKEIMGKIRARNTQPEIIVRSILHKLGYRFRLHRKDLPGRPDIVLPKHKIVIYVNGCFWHQHECSRGCIPETNYDFWKAKLRRNVDRDRENWKALVKLGWRVLIVWECKLKQKDELSAWLKEQIQG